MKKYKIGDIVPFSNLNKNHYYSMKNFPYPNAFNKSNGIGIVVKKVTDNMIYIDLIDKNNVLIKGKEWAILRKHNIIFTRARKPKLNHKKL